ncbi:MAG TPA: two-component regulator propeller domain-containing protein [Steroidobacteraceae bacterium]|nr:two-component regulator propeller domain-containing protein [Steroidobacteraceae bacterium]
MKHRQNSRTALTICGFLLLFLTGSASALDAHRLISQYAHTVWKVQDGFPRGPNTITQTKDGYVWISGGGDLLRYDGVTFAPLPPQKSFQTKQGINSLLGSRDGSLWMATYQGGFSRLNKDGDPFSFSIKKGGVNSIIEDHAGTIWITRDHLLGSEGALCRVVGDDLKCYGKDKSDGNPAHIATALAEDSSGDIWFGCQMVCRWNGSSISHYMEEQMDHPSGDGVVALAAGPAGSVWVAMDGVGPGLGVRHYSNGRFLSYEVPGFNGATIRATALFVDRQQTLWVGTASQGLYHIHDGHADQYGAAQGLTGNEVRSVYEDREGNLWLTTDKGVDLFRDTPIVSFSSTEGLNGDAGAVIARKDGSVWIGVKGALAIIHGDSVSLTTVADKHPIQNVYALLEDHSGQVWLGIDRTVMRYELGKFSEIKRQDGRPLDHIGKIISFTEDVDGNIWAIAFDDPGRMDHLLRIRDRRVQEDVDLSSLVPRRAHFLGADPAGGIWIGTGDGKLAHYLNGVAKIVYPGRSDGPRLTMFSLVVDSAGVVWGPANHGLYRWDHGKLNVMDPHNGLSCPESTAALMDRSGSLWLEGDCGYERIPATDLANWTARPEDQVTVTTLGTLDGADSGWNEDRIQPNAAMSPDGRLWFVGSSSIQMIDPGRSYKNPTPPPVHVEGLVADGKSYTPASPITLPPLTRDLHIDYTALSFVLPQRMGFRYMLEGRDRGWQDPGLRRQAFYSDLRPGSYRFRVIASNNDGVWNESGATLEFKVAAAWYQMIWFRALCFVAGVLLLWAIYRLRLHRIAGSMKARFDERLAERTRIARDLHDTFLQTIQGSKFVADDALSATIDLPHMRLAMEKLSVWLGRATDEGRAALNSLRTSAMEVIDLAGGFQQALEECRIHGPMEVSLEASGQSQEMHPIVRDEVYRIGYEAIRNACVHSHATQMRVELSYAQDLSLCISDNGTGIDPDILHRGKRGHFGLQSMRERAARIMGKFSIESSAASGTVITLTVPGGIIYRTVNTQPPGG